MAGINNHVLLLQGALYVRRSKAQCGNLRLGYIDIDSFRLYAVEDDARYSFDHTQFLAQFFCCSFKFGIAVSVARNRQHEPVDKTEIITDNRFSGAGGKGGLYILNFFAHDIPHLGQTIGPVLTLDIHFNNGSTRARIGINPFYLNHLLQLGLDEIGNFQFHLLSAGTRIFGYNRGCFNGKLRVFELAQLEIAGDTAQQNQQRGKIGDRFLLNCEGRKIHLPASCADSPKMVTCWPSVSVCRPAVTIQSPLLIPS